MTLEELSEEEKLLVLQLREEKRRKTFVREQVLEICRVAYEYEKWLVENGVGDSYSTFCDEFQPEMKNIQRYRSDIYDLIHAFREKAQDMAKNYFVMPKEEEGV